MRSNPELRSFYSYTFRWRRSFYSHNNILMRKMVEICDRPAPNTSLGSQHFNVHSEKQTHCSSINLDITSNPLGIPVIHHNY
jgi:hypothetical protein